MSQSLPPDFSPWDAEETPAPAPRRRLKPGMKTLLWTLAVGGVFTVALFGAFDVRRRQDRLPIAVGLLLLAGWNVFSKLLVAGCASLGFDPTSIPGMSLFFPSGKIRLFDLYQFARMAALPLLFAYNGERGIAKDSRFYKAVQYGFYAFYPLHLLLLWGLKYVRVL